MTQVANQATLAGTNFTAVPSDDPSTPQAADATVTNLTAAPKVAVTKAVALLTDVTGDAQREIVVRTDGGGNDPVVSQGLSVYGRR